MSISRTVPGWNHSARTFVAKGRTPSHQLVTPQRTGDRSTYEAPFHTLAGQRAPVTGARTRAGAADPLESALEALRGGEARQVSSPPAGLWHPLGRFDVHALARALRAMPKPGAALPLDAIRGGSLLRHESGRLFLEVEPAGRGAPVTFELPSAGR